MLEQVVQRAQEFDVIHFHSLAVPLSARATSPDGARDDDARAARHARARAALRRVRRYPGRVDFRCAARAAAGGRLDRHGLSRAPVDLLPFHPGPGSTWPFSAAFAGETRRSRDCDRHRLRATAADRGQGRSRRSRLLRATRSVRCWTIRWSSSSARSTSNEKAAFLGGATALLFPIDWPEPFGLVMIEALACGTPVVAFRGGSVPEVIDDGVTGFIVDSLEKRSRRRETSTSSIDRRCRAVFERRFSSARMARDYVALYEQLLARTIAATRPDRESRDGRDAEARRAVRHPRRGRASRCDRPRDEAGRHLRRVRSARRHHARTGKSVRALSRGHAISFAARAVARQPAPLFLSSTVGRGQRSFHRRSDQSGRRARRQGRARLAARCICFALRVLCERRCPSSVSACQPRRCDPIRVAAHGLGSMPTSPTCSKCAGRAARAGASARQLIGQQAGAAPLSRSRRRRAATRRSARTPDRRVEDGILGSFLISLWTARVRASSNSRLTARSVQDGALSNPVRRSSWRAARAGRLGATSVRSPARTPASITGCADRPPTCG